MAEKTKRKVIKIIDIDYLIALLSPQFILEDECIFFQPHLSRENYDAYWRKRVAQDPRKVERTINHVHLGDIVENLGDQKEIGEKIQSVWERHLRKDFPDRVFEITLSKSDDEEPEWLLELSS